ncbi:MAG: sulfatase [Solirubrobacterales bacterium]|jgi:arylsulfatase A-like enzyme|nr:sulfatase [Solirubrobacterales bacterium]
MRERASGAQARGGLLLAVAAVVTCLVAAVFPDEGEAKKKGAPEQKRPNIVMVMTDDQTVESLRAMPIVNKRIAQAGVSFPNSFASFPLCCPSRATMLTGQYPDNHGVRTNQPPNGGYATLVPTEGNAMPVWLQRAGYYTAHIGKYLNGYGASSVDTHVPPGWSEWYGSLDDPDGFIGGTYTMYGYTLNENGSIVHYGSTPDAVDPATYQTDVYAVKAEDFINRRAPKGKPFYLSVAPLAPHGEAMGVCNCAGDNPRAAVRHQGRFASEPVPRPPSFNEADVSDKPAGIQALTPINATQRAAIDDRYRARLESLLAVDEMVGRMVSALKARDELDRTVFIFTSDNGFFHGEHRLRSGKVRHYEESSGVPLIVRGPGVPKGEIRRQLAVNADLAPTILDFADAAPGRTMDGRSLVPLMEDKLLQPGRGILIEGFNNADPDDLLPSYSAVRTDRYVYAETGTDRELYDLRGDPFQLQSLSAVPALDPVEASLDRLLARLTACVGAKPCAARPALKLALKFGRDGKCVSAGIRAKVSGAAVPEVLDARFYANGRAAGGAGSAPFDAKIGAKKLSRSGKNRVTANATMLDGRGVTVKRSAPRACG